ncbi:TetR family transcriptional regulator [Natranaerovirga hydrolytica]|uniref:TetR family transcriptional regulator n=1 Tax=Natranaerovirga hydrolytica TaxID=680378 RepID=A0A4R1N5A2_9FIRM|nr:TetR/AcrR family transcriptional regulator [Natranaerovirga hydrolytica]TCK98159.1 TetR family transcriptional regulator [Natranaerovirga hydrolytica]
MPTQRFENLPKEKKEKIIHAMVDVFAQKGIDDTDIADIVKKAEIARGSFYSYFEDKDDAIFFIMDLIKKEKLVRLEGLFEEAEDIPFIDFYYKAFVISLDFAKSSPKYVSIGASIFTSRNKKVEEYIRKGMESFFPYYSKLIDKDKAKGIIHSSLDNRSIILLLNNATSDIAINTLYKNQLPFEEVQSIFDDVFQIIKKGLSM